MPVDPTREAAVKKQVEQEFADMEQASRNAGAGVLDVLQVYGGAEAAMQQVDAYLTLLSPTPPNFSTTGNANLER